MDSYPKFKVAAVQTSPIFLDREGTVEKSCELIREAGSKGAKIIVFPESYIPTHPLWYAFVRSEESMKYYRELFKNAVEIPSDATAKLCAAARDADAYVVMGMNEKNLGTLGTLYNTQLFIDRTGHIMGKHRKIMPTTTERLVHTGGDGSTLNVFNTEYGELGGLICGENSNALARFTLLAGGEKIHATSWPTFMTKGMMRSKYAMEIRLKNHAIEGKVFVIGACGYFSDEMVEILCDTEEKRALLHERGGGSSIIGPDGHYIAGPLEEGEGIVYGDVDIEKIIDAKMLQDLVGHYNRFDIFKLQVNRDTHQAIEGIPQTSSDELARLRVENEELRKALGVKDKAKVDAEEVLVP